MNGGTREGLQKECDSHGQGQEGLKGYLQMGKLMPRESPGLA